MATTPTAGATTPLMTLDEVVEYTRLSKRWLYSQARSGLLPAILIARTYRFRLADVDAFLDGFRISRDSESS